MLTPEQITKVRTAAGSQPLDMGGSVPAPAPQPLSVRLGLKIPDEQQPKMPETFMGLNQGNDSLAAKYAQNLGKDYQQIAKNFTDIPGETKDIIEAPGISAGNLLPRVLHGTLHATSKTIANTLSAVYAPITEAAKTAIPTGEGKISRPASTIAQGALGGAVLGGPQGAVMGAGLSLIPIVSDAVKQIPQVRDYLKDHPNAEEEINNAMTTAMFYLGIKASEKSAPKGQPDVLHADVMDVPGRVLTNLSNTIKAPINPVINAIRSKLAERNVDPNLKSSTERLIEKSNQPQENQTQNKLQEGDPNTDRQGIGQSKIKDPLKQYEDYLNQEKKFKSDIKQDTALSKVGEEVGQEFDKVVKLRREYGNTMSKELDKVGDIKTDISNPASSLSKELVSQGSKIAKQDASLVKSYKTELEALGSNPTVRELDSFISRKAQELDLYKSKNNITGVTNGERIIKTNLSQLRDQLSPEATNNPALQGYSDAKAGYAYLSDFLDEGVKFLGNKNSSGDYVKDASILKSSVQSILNGGKKDWLLQLEDMTGNPVLDKAVLALQAMKDSGNFRGQSLLEQMNTVPNSSGSLVNRMINYGVQKAGRVIAGTPEEQTRIFLKNLENSNPQPTAIPTVSESNPANKEIAGKVDNTKILGEARAYENSVQKLSETSGGWQEGVKKIFDDALHTGDKLTVRALINQDAVPAEYLKAFAKDIQKVLGKK